MSALGNRERSLPHLMGHQPADHQSVVGASILLGHVDEQEPLLSRFLYQRRHQARFLMPYLLRFRQYFSLYESSRRLLNQFLLVAKVLRDEKPRLGNRGSEE